MSISQKADGNTKMADTESKLYLPTTCCSTSQGQEFEKRVGEKLSANPATETASISVPFFTTLIIKSSLFNLGRRAL